MKIINWMERKMALSNQGAKNFIFACLWTGVQNISFVLPVMLVYLLVEGLFGEETTLSLWRLVWMSVASLLCMYLVTLKQYDSTYLAVYSESASMRIRLAEKLRRLPLSFFDRHDASDMTNRGYLSGMWACLLRLAISLVSLLGSSGVAIDLVGLFEVAKAGLYQDF